MIPHQGWPRFLAILLVATSPAPLVAQEPKDDGLNAESRKLATTQIRNILDRTRITRLDDPSSTVALVPNPVLNFSDVPRGHHYGMLWVWGDEGRPAAIIETYTRDFENNISAWPGNVMHSLSPQPLRGEADFAWTWSPRDSGITFVTLQDAPAPSATPAARLIQMRALSKRFAARETWQGDTSELRLLPTPVWRYRAEADGLVDGALFALSHGGTNPELVLLLEAVTAKTGPEWRVGCARMGHAEIHVTFDDREIWAAKLLETAESNSPYYWINPP